MEFGITLTFILVCISSFQAIALGVGYEQAGTIDVIDQAGYGGIQDSVGAEKGPQSSYATFSPPTTLVEFLFFIPTLVIAIGGMIWSMAFGWTYLIYSILRPVGLEVVVGWPLIGIFGFIQLFTFLEIIRRLISAIRGATP